MSAIAAADLAALVAAPCSACGGRTHRARAVLSGAMTFAAGEPVSSVEWIAERERLHERVYRVECAGCGAASFERDECPACGARGGLARALERRNGVTPPGSCPRCDHEELRLQLEARMHVIYVLGRESRRVLDAAAHDDGFHVTEAVCRSCGEKVASVSQRCAVCGRSSLLRKVST